MTEQSKVTTHGDGGSMHTGPEAIERYRLLAIRSALLLESHGVCVHRRVSALKLAQAATGLSTRDRRILRTRLAQMVVELEKKIVFERKEST